jgi:hypothetical protein
MVGSQISDSALVVTAVAALVLAVAALVLVVRRGLQAFSVRGPGGIEARLEAVHHDVRQINKAVNQVPANTPPLVDRVQVMERKQDYQLLALRMIAAHVGANLPPPDEETSL